MVVRGEMRGVVVGMYRNPGQSPGSHPRDSSQRDTARYTCFAVTCALTSFRNAAFSASAPYSRTGPPILPHGATPSATLCLGGLGPGSRNWKFSPTPWPNWKFIAVPSSSQRVLQLWSNQTCSTWLLFWSRKWPSKATNHHFFTAAPTCLTTYLLVSLLAYIKSLLLFLTWVSEYFPEQGRRAAARRGDRPTDPVGGGRYGSAQGARVSGSMSKFVDRAPTEHAGTRLGCGRVL